jgi:hypothetical protein
MENQDNKTAITFKIWQPINEELEWLWFKAHSNTQHWTHHETLPRIEYVNNSWYKGGQEFFPHSKQDVITTIEISQLKSLAEKHKYTLIDPIDKPL